MDNKKTDEEPPGSRENGRRGRDPGGGDPSRRYADKLKTGVRYDQVLKRNVLDISLEGDDPGKNNIEPGDVQSQPRDFYF